MPESQYLQAVENALDEDCTDTANGGVPPSEIAQRVDGDLESVRRHLRRLVEDGKLEQVQGADPETFRPRASYLPGDADA